MKTDKEVEDIIKLTIAETEARMYKEFLGELSKMLRDQLAKQPAYSSFPIIGKTTYGEVGVDMGGTYSYGPTTVSTTIDGSAVVAGTTMPKSVWEATANAMATPVDKPVKKDAKFK